MKWRWHHTTPQTSSRPRVSTWRTGQWCWHEGIYLLQTLRTQNILHNDINNRTKAQEEQTSSVHNDLFTQKSSPVHFNYRSTRRVVWASQLYSNSAAMFQLQATSDSKLSTATVGISYNCCSRFSSTEIPQTELLYTEFSTTTQKVVTFTI